MAEGGFFYQAFVYLTAAAVSVPIAKRLGLGSVLGYLIAGVAIGPFGLDFVGEKGQDIMHFAEFGVVMMLFLVGLELEPSLLWRLRAASLLLVIGIALLMSKVGLSPALGTCLAGVVLANSEFRHELETDIGPFKGLLLGLFFIAVGASIDFGLIVSHPGMIAGLVGGLIVLKLVVLLVLGKLFKLSLCQNLLFGFALAQGGEFAFVLFSFALQNGVLTGELVASLVAVSMAVAPLLMLVNEKLIQPRFGTREAAERQPDEIDEHNPVIIAGFGRFGHIIGRLLLANGVGTTVLDVDSDQVDMLRNLGLKVFYGDASRAALLRAAGAGSAQVLIVAVDGKDKALEIVHTAQKHFPNLKILSRAHGRPHAYDLLDAGVEHVCRETLDTSLHVGIDALCVLGYRRHQALRAARKFRRHDEASVRELAGVWKDSKQYIVRAREIIRSAEQLIRSEVQEGREHEHDSAWDTASLLSEYGKQPEDQFARTPCGIRAKTILRRT